MTYTGEDIVCKSGLQEKEPSEAVLRTEVGNHSLLCTQGVKVTFHNTSETGLMEGLVHGFCLMGKRTP